MPKKHLLTSPAINLQGGDVRSKIIVFAVFIVVSSFWYCLWEMPGWIPLILKSGEGLSKT